MKLLPVLLLAAALPLASAEKTKLEIKVINDLGKPVGNASVVVKFVSGRSVILTKVRTTWELRTSQEGTVKIPEIPQGQIRIQVIAKNYQTFGQIFDITNRRKRSRSTSSRRSLNTRRIRRRRNRCVGGRQTTKTDRLAHANGILELYCQYLNQ